MEKRNFKVYEAPQVEVVEMEVQNALLSLSVGFADGEGEWGED